MHESQWLPGDGAEVEAKQSFDCRAADRAAQITAAVESAHPDLEGALQAGLTDLKPEMQSASNGALERTREGCQHPLHSSAPLNADVICHCAEKGVHHEERTQNDDRVTRGCHSSLGLGARWSRGDADLRSSSVWFGKLVAGGWECQRHSWWQSWYAAGRGDVCSWNGWAGIRL